MTEIPIVATVCCALWVTLHGASDIRAYERIGLLAEAIARAEGFHRAESLVYRANNPGGLVVGGLTIGSHRITVFPSSTIGWQRLHAFIERINAGQVRGYTPEMSLQQIGRRWARDENWGRNVASALQRLGVPATRRTTWRSVIGGS